MIFSRTFRIVELLLLMVVLPSALFYYQPHAWLAPILWATALYANAITRAITPPKQRIGWNAKAVTRAALAPILIRFAISAALLAIATWLFRPDMLFGFIRTKPAFWALVMVLYPILSAAPQEIIFREFFYRRYTAFFPERDTMIVASALAFAFSHIFFQNWVAPVLCLIGGVMFAGTYERHRSLLLVTLEHSLYGCFIFTLGLGYFFYHGAVH